MNIKFQICFVLHETQQHSPLSVPMFSVNRSLGSSSGPHWSHGNLILDVNGNWIRPVTGDAEKNPRCCITNELSTEVVPLLWEAATGNCCYLSVERLKKNRMLDVRCQSCSFSDTENSENSKQIGPCQMKELFGLWLGNRYIWKQQIILLICLLLKQVSMVWLLFPEQLWGRILQLFTCQI